MEHGAEAVAAASFIEITPLVVIALITLGLFGGLLSGFIGSGGAFVLTPGMMNLGVDGAVAVASNMAHKFPKAIVGAWKRRKLGHVDIKLGLVMAMSAIVGVQVGIQIQRMILDVWGKAGSNLYISLVFVIVLFVVGTYVLIDGTKTAKDLSGDTVPALAQKARKIQIPPVLFFKQANAKVSVWVSVPLGFATGVLAATIAVGGFIGVPSMIYVIGAPAFVASGTELIVAFVMGLTGAFTWALGGYVDLRLTALILAGSLVGVQIGAIGTSYVKEYMIKIVTGTVMILAGVSRIIVIPTYLDDLDIMPLSDGVTTMLNNGSLVMLYTTLVGSGVLIVGAMIKGKIAVGNSWHEIQH